MKIKKILYNLALGFLTAGASLILGFLSFGGMYTLLPFLPLAYATFSLSVIYDAEIYLQNIKGSFNKIFKNNYLKLHLAKEYLLTHFPKNTEESNCPQFFDDYKKQLELLAEFEHKKLTKEQIKHKKEIKKRLEKMEEFFSLILFPIKKATEETISPYSKQLEKWFAETKQEQDIWLAKLIKRRSIFYAVSVLSVFSAIFMSLGSTYLIVEAFSIIPWLAAIPFAALPIIIVPMALISGIAYGLLTYNTITDLINNDTINKWYKKIRDDLTNNVSVRTVFMASMAVLLALLATALTICTAGTWWTIASNAQPLFNWMKRMPTFIMGVINPIITGISAVFFNIQNTSESLDMLDETTRSIEKNIQSKTNVFEKMYQSLKKGVNHLNSSEHWLQIINPLRLILKLTITPLRILFFLGHIASIALTADRMPGIPQIVAALIALITEGFEDAHYFIGHHHHHHNHSTEELLDDRLKSHTEHNHDKDIPTKILQTIAIPLYALTALWDWAASQLNSSNSLAKKLTLMQAWNKQLGIKAEKADLDLKTTTQTPPSKEWKSEYILALIKKYEFYLDTVVIGKKNAQQKKTALKELKDKISNPGTESLTDIVNTAKSDPRYNKHRLFTTSKEPTNTRAFIDDLAARISF